MAEEQRGVFPHHFGVTMLNLGLVSILQDRPFDALAELDEASDALEATSAAIETSSLFVLRAAVLAQLGRLIDADALVNSALARPDLRTEADLVLEAAEYEDLYGDPDRATAFLDEADSFPGLSLKHRWIRSLVGARFLIRRRRYDEATLMLAEYGDDRRDESRARSGTPCRYCPLGGVDWRPSSVGCGEERTGCGAVGSGAHRSRRIADLLVAFQSPDEEFSTAVTSIGARSPWHLTYLADLLVRRADNLDAQAADATQRAMQMHPRHWRQALRYELDSSIGPHKVVRWTSTRVDRGYLRHPQTTSHKSIAEACSGCGRSRTRARPALGISSRGRGPRAHDRHRRSEHDPGDEYSASCPRVAGSSADPP